VTQEEVIMALVTPNEGQLELLANALITSGFTGYDYDIDLFQNNYTPVQGSTASDFTVATFTGYVQVVATRADFVTPTTVSNQATTSLSLNPLTWTCGTTGNTIYGYLVRSSLSGKVLWAELLPSGPYVLTSGQIFQLNININLFGANP
jgi:hypothetical protein